jgi:hypothetical protein
MGNAKAFTGINETSIAAVPQASRASFDLFICLVEQERGKPLRLNNSYIKLVSSKELNSGAKVDKCCHWQVRSDAKLLIN